MSCEFLTLSVKCSVEVVDNVYDLNVKVLHRPQLFSSRKSNDDMSVLITRRYLFRTAMSVILSKSTRIHTTFQAPSPPKPLQTA